MSLEVASAMRANKLDALLGRQRSNAHWIMHTGLCILWLAVVHLVTKTWSSKLLEMNLGLNDGQT